MKDTEEAIRRWDIVAEEIAATYTHQGDRSREVLLNPVLIDLLGPVENKEILDAGCGEGYLSRILADKGAHVVAVDYSRKMLEIAKKRTLSDKVKYYYGNCENLQFLKSETFDIIVSNMVLQDLADYGGAMREMFRLLVKNGLFIFSISHPCFTTPDSGWIKEDGIKLYWKVDKYFCEVPFDQKWPTKARVRILLFHRTLTSYFRTIRESGFTIEDIIEPKPSEEMIQSYPNFKDDLRMCHFLVFKLRK
ncbi:MAG: class I SAM-dependent methyltransferase [Theionarchaea archaeon]|nr:class I SAM-dependent methyltransferase [Theionarchaea archaeon]